MKTLFTPILLAATLGLSSCAFAPMTSTAAPSSKAVTTPKPVESTSGTYNPARSFAPLVKAIEPAVVAIEVENRVTRPSFNGRMPPGFEDFFGEMLPPRGGPQGPQTVRGEGSGFIISDTGLVLTNHHVIDGAESIRARFTDGRTVELTLVGSDERTDVALVQLPKTEKWPYVALDSGPDPEVGDWVIAVGNPLGLGTTVTAGIISGKGRDLPNGNAYDQFLQTDAAINQGNSGGPLFNIDGKVVGMNTAIIQGANTVGFSIPVHIIQRVRKDLETRGYVSRGFIGVSAQPLNAELAEALGTGTENGALVAKVYDGAPAHGAGLVPGDVIVKIDGAAIKDPSDLVRAVGDHHPGEKIAIVYIRDGKRRQAQLKLAELPGSEKELSTSHRPRQTLKGDETLAELGLELGRLSPQLSAKAGVKQGVLVQSVVRGSPVYGRLEAGDVVVQVNNRPVKEPKEVSDILKSSRGTVSFLVIRGQRQMYIALSLR